MDNALRHMPPGGTLLLHAGPFAGGVRMTISDAGEGIPPADLPYVFGCFWRGDRADAEV